MPELAPLNKYRQKGRQPQRNYFKQFLGLMNRYGVRSADAENLFGEIAARYTAPDRHYHDLGHVHQVLDVARDLSGNDQAPDAVELALWFHDVIYDPAVGSQNEKRSAEFAADRLSLLGFPDDVIDQVFDLIMETTHKDPPTHPNGDIVVDSDLYPLAVSEDEFELNSADIRKEYQSVPDPLYRVGRVDLLRRFLARDRLFYNETMYTRYEKKARRNLSREISRIEAQLHVE